jgi:hypothetical protein
MPLGSDRATNVSSRKAPNANRTVEIGLSARDGNRLLTNDGNYSNISFRCYNTIRNENYSFKFSCDTKRLIIILYGLWCIKACEK